MSSLIEKLRSEFPSGIILGSASAIVGPIGLTLQGFAGNIGNLQKWQLYYNEGEKLSIIEIINDTTLLCTCDGRPEMVNPKFLKGLEIKKTKKDA